ncbi:MAG: HAMP domain-containing histidine kinase [Alphaproteobacteria bacterium]|nr:HAMP domain-containing histidine kinase [Alphaproteobacteria bacterium]MCB9794546.1 HAMP domain-containing histidine kinase [Alphaproteobacteria bacterium]
MSRASETYYKPPRPDSVEGRLRQAGVWGAIALALVLALVAMVDFSRVTELSGTLATGEQRLMEAALVEALGPQGGVPDDEDLAEVLDRNRGNGLSYLELQSPDGATLARAGVAQLMSPGRVGEHVRSRSEPPARPPERGGGARPSAMGGPPPAPGEAMGGPPPAPGMRPPPEPALIFEMELRMAPALESSAKVSLALSLSVAVSLIFGALALRRVSARAASLSVKLQRERHLAALGEMSAVLAHELRNPIASLKGNAQLLVEVLEKPKLRGRAEWLVTEATRMEDLTNDLLDFARSGMVNRQEVDPREVIDEVLRELEPRRVSLRAEGLPARWPLDPMRLHQALVNLTRNALQAAEEPPPELSARVEGTHLVFVVRDHGAGLPEDLDPEQLFQAFRTTRTRGTGLGLAVVRRVADLHGGSVTADNHPEGGARFTLRIPRT